MSHPSQIPGSLSNVRALALLLLGVLLVWGCRRHAPLGDGAKLEDCVVLCLPIAHAGTNWEFSDRDELAGSVVHVDVWQEGGQPWSSEATFGEKTDSWQPLASGSSLATGDGGASFGFITSRCSHLPDGATVALRLELPRDAQGSTPFLRGYLAAGRYTSRGRVQRRVGELGRVGGWETQWEPIITSTEGWLAERDAAFPPSKEMLAGRQAMRGDGHELQTRKYFVTPALWQEAEESRKGDAGTATESGLTFYRKFLAGCGREGLADVVVLSKGRDFALLRGRADELDKILREYDSSGMPVVVPWDLRESRVLFDHSP